MPVASTLRRRTITGPTHTIINRWRLLGWGVAATLLLLPFLAVQLGSREVNWSSGDFIVIGFILGTVGLAFELVVWRNGSRPYRLGTALALIGGLMLSWINLAVGYIGDGASPVNALLLGLPAFALLGAASFGFRPAGVAKIMMATAIAHGIIVALGLTTALGGGDDHPGIVTLATMLFIAMWLGAAALFARAARGS